MKKLYILFLLISSTSFSQIFKPVSWENSVEKISTNEYQITFTAHIERDWHLYAIKLPEGGPLPTLFSFDKDSDYTLIGKIEQAKGITKYDKTFEMDVTYFEISTSFKQRIKTTQKELTITGTIDYMSCNHQQCVILFDEFEIEL